MFKSLAIIFACSSAGGAVAATLLREPCGLAITVSTLSLTFAVLSLKEE